MPESQAAAPEEPDALSLALLQARRDMWKYPPRYLPFFFGPLREFCLDPGMAIAGILLPLATRSSFPRVNRWMASFVQAVYVPILQFLYRKRQRHNEPKVGMKAASRNSILGPTNINRVIVIDPPSSTESAFLGVLSFVVSVIGDVFGALTNPQKYQGWMDACTQLQSYLVSTGVSQELHKAIVHPLLQGRLLSNVKILSDIQESHLCVDRAKAAQFPTETTPPVNLSRELKDGHKWMRFATAAYGTEMIRSALDREVVVEGETSGSSERMLHELESAIAFHCQIQEEDILLVYTDTQPNKHTLHHFLAVDHASKSIVLALRGTLSLSGAIVDVRGMTTDYCTGQAHSGMAEMADNVWEHSGERILQIINDDDNKYKGYTFLITGHSLGAGTACLLNLKLHVQGQLGSGWPIRCFAFAPPPTFLACTTEPIHDAVQAEKSISSIEQAIQHTVAYIHSNDVVPHLSVSAIRRLAFLFDAVDQQTRRVMFWKRWRIFYDYDPVPPEWVRAVVNAEAGGRSVPREIEGACELIIPARVVVWCHETDIGKFEAYGCDPTRVAQGRVFLSQDMLTDHLPEQYENALDALIVE